MKCKQEEISEVAFEINTFVVSDHPVERRSQSPLPIEGYKFELQMPPRRRRCCFGV